MKQIALAIIALAFFASPAFAQPQPPSNLQWEPVYTYCATVTAAALKLTWDPSPPSPGVDILAYAVERQTRRADGTWVDWGRGWTSGHVTEREDKLVNSGQRLRYRIRALSFQDRLLSDPSNMIELAVPWCPGMTTTTSTTTTSTTTTSTTTTTLPACELLLLDCEATLDAIIAAALEYFLTKGP